jgi:protein subunit release factor A
VTTTADPSKSKREPILIPESDEKLLAQCRIDTFRSGGKGGQHQNTTDTGVRLTHLPTGVVVTVRQERSQHQNRRLALRRLRERLEKRNQKRRPRIPSRVPPRERRKRLEKKRRRSRLKELRRKPDRQDCE